MHPSGWEALQIVGAEEFKTPSSSYRPNQVVELVPPLSRGSFPHLMPKETIGLMPIVGPIPGFNDVECESLTATVDGSFPTRKRLSS